MDRPIINIKKRNPELFSKAFEFTEKRSSQESEIGNYRKRFQYNPNKINQDILCGILGEVAFYIWASEDKKYYNMPPPDFTIYDNLHKSWTPDFTFTENNIELKIHIKSQDVKQANRFGECMVLQKSNQNGKGGHDVGIYNCGNNDFLVHCIILDKNIGIVKINEIINVKTVLSNNLLQKPVLTRLEKIKEVIYIETNPNSTLRSIRGSGLSTGLEILPEN